MHINIYMECSSVIFCCRGFIYDSLTAVPTRILLKGTSKPVSFYQKKQVGSSLHSVSVHCSLFEIPYQPKSFWWENKTGACVHLFHRGTIFMFYFILCIKNTVKKQTFFNSNGKLA